MNALINKENLIRDNIETWIKDKLFDVVPIAIAIIDPQFNLVYANNAFSEMFGEWRNRKCYAVYKNRTLECSDCKGRDVFMDGTPRSHEEVGYDKDGQMMRYINHTIPIIDKDGNIPFLVEMITDITEIERVRKERQLLFDQVPCNVLLIDKNFRIVRTNKKIREKFGDIEGKYCFESLKGLGQKCSECTAEQTFKDGETHTGNSIVKDKEGKTVQFQVTTVPLKISDGKFDLVMEMAVDVTQILKLKEELKYAYAFVESMIATSLDGIIALDSDGDVTIFNEASRKIFNIIGKKQVTRDELELMLPSGFLDQIAAGPGHVYLPETEVETVDERKIPVRLTGFQFQADEKYMGIAINIQDLRELKQLEKDKLEAERLAAVGQTVAGLAHGIKNLITGLEGGIYMLNSGMTKGNVERIQEGMEMLGRNVDRISIFVKEFLSFSKGREIRVEINNPQRIAQEVVDLYSSKAKNIGIELKYTPRGEVKEAPLDYEGIHECLTNLVGNAIDACQMSDNTGCRVWVSVFEENDVIIYEVADDGCGMDYEVRKKVFTSFFTTKGLGGTGLGLLTTKKIIQEHGGKIDMESEIGKGTTFRLKLPRRHLPKMLKSKDH